MMQNRTHTCGELRLSDAGRAVKLCGWLENVREVGSELAFAVVRDFYGTTQVVAETADMVKTLKAITKESTISVEGTVRERDSKNPKLPTGDIEVVPEKIAVLGRCQHSELPFPINRSREADEATRLKYRYLDLRNPAVKDNIILRCSVVSALRQAMTAHGFLEITTPILTASSPEGARDYLVPARNHPGKFYALPQAPQQFKQLLMTSGFDRYFQIAPCFRDEDARADRSPGEFYQLDMEMAFASQDDVFAVCEDVLPPIFAKYGKYDRASSAPFLRIPYAEAMETYGSDKPDLRIDLTVQDVTSVLAGCGFGPFEGNTVKAVVVSDFHETRKFIDKTLADVEVVSGSKPYWFRLDESGEVVGGIAKFVAPIKDAGGLRPGPEGQRLRGPVRRQAVPGPEDRRRAGQDPGRRRPRPHGQGAVRLLLDRGLPHVRDRRGVRRAGVLPQPLLHARRRPGGAAEGGAGRDRPPDHHRRPVRPGVQRRGALLRRGAEPRPGDHDQGL